MMQSNHSILHLGDLGMARNASSIFSISSVDQDRDSATVFNEIFFVVFFVVIPFQQFSVGLKCRSPRVLERMLAVELWSSFHVRRAETEASNTIIQSLKDTQMRIDSYTSYSTT